MIESAVNIDVNVNGTQTVQQASQAFEDLGDAVAKTQRQAEELALQFGINDERTQEAIRTAGKYKQQLELLDQAVDAHRGGQETLFRAVQGVGAGFEVATGAMALFGSESKELNTILVKVQGAMVFTQGLKDLKEFAPAISSINKGFLNMVKSLGAVKIALATTGIGAIVALVATFSQEIGKMFDGLIKKAKALSDEYLGTNFGLEELIKNQLKLVEQGERELALMEAQERKDSELYAKKIANAEEYLKLKELELQALEDGDEGYKEAVKAVEDAKNSIAILEATETQRLKAVRAERLKAEQDFTQNLMNLRLQEIKDQRDALKAIQQLTDQYGLDQFVTSRQKELDEYITIVKSKFQTLYREVVYQSQLQATQLRNQKEEELKLLEDALDKGYITELQYKQKKANLDDYYAKLEEQRVKQREQAKRDIQEQIAMDTMTTIINLNDVFRGSRDKQSKQEFERDKAFNIAQTLISTYFSAMRMFAAQSNPVSGGIAAAAAIATGLAQVQKIRRTTYEVNSPTSTSVSSALPQMSPQTITASSLPQSSDFITADRRVYVLEGDIKRVTNRVNNTQAVSVVE